MRSDCPIATTLEFIGDRWTLVLLRDLLNGKRRFKDFLQSPERITTNVLTTRLAQMLNAGLVTKRPYQHRPVRFEYTLTTKGKALHPLLKEMCIWGNRFYPKTWTPPPAFMASDYNNAEN